MRERIGVWVEDGKVFRRDSEKQVYPSIYEPVDAQDLEKVRLLAESLHSGASMAHWTAQVEAQQDEILEKLNSLIIQEEE